MDMYVCVCVCVCVYQHQRLAQEHCGSDPTQLIAEQPAFNLSALLGGATIDKLGLFSSYSRSLLLFRPLLLRNLLGGVTTAV